jgi:hypothetical protein
MATAQPDKLPLTSSVPDRRNHSANLCIFSDGSLLGGCSIDAQIHRSGNSVEFDEQDEGLDVSRNTKQHE